MGASGKYHHPERMEITQPKGLRGTSKDVTKIISTLHEACRKTTGKFTPGV